MYSRHLLTGNHNDVALSAAVLLDYDLTTTQTHLILIIITPYLP